MALLYSEGSEDSSALNLRSPGSGEIVSSHKIGYGNWTASLFLLNNLVLPIKKKKYYKYFYFVPINLK